MLVLDGKKVSADRRELLKSRVAAFKQATGRAPALTVMLVGEHLPSQVYVRNKVKACEAVGIASQVLRLAADISVADFKKEVAKIEEDDKIDGLLVQLPLPDQLKSVDMGSELSVEKDSDGFTYGNLGLMIGGRLQVAPCTPMGVMSILKHYNIPVEGKHVVVVGRSLIVGKPMALLALEANATVSICHSKTKNLLEMTQQGDIVVVAAGRREFLGREAFKKGAVVIDVGIHGSGEGQKICGDVRFAELEGWASAATPVPGGVGPMTITTLLENTMALAEIRAGLKK